MSLIPVQTRQAAKTVREDAADLLRARRSRLRTDLDEREKGLLDAVRRDGFATLEGYWPKERALALRDKLEQFLAHGGDRDFDKGAYMRFQDGNSVDSGVRRIYHVERLVPELAEFRYDPFPLRVAAAYYGLPFHSSLLLYQHNLRSNDVTRSYHVDSFAKEFKSFLYLDDVDPGNGPFAYLRGSQKRHLARLRKQLSRGPDGGTTTFGPDGAGSLRDEEVQITGEAGTLIVTDVRGLHRGTPQSERSRSVLVNYITRHENDLLLAK